MTRPWTAVTATLCMIGVAGAGWSAPLRADMRAPGQAAPAAAGAASTAPSPETLDKLLAPVALYPDQLLSQMLLCAQTAPKVQELSGWLIRNPELKGTALQDAVQKAGFEPSFVVLALFPQVVNFMADDIAWTKQVGAAFTANRQGVLDSVQRLRAQCQKAGNLKSTSQQKVETEKTSTGQQVIVIEPTNPQVVYVPQYNPQVVYTQPSTTVVVQQESNSTGAAVAGAVVGFAAGIAIGAAMDNDHYYGPYGWGGGPRMYNDAWNDYYDDRQDAREDYYEHREDAREDYYDNREDARENAGDRSKTAQQERTNRQQTRQNTASGTRSAGTASGGNAATASATSATATTQSRTAGGASAEARGTTQRQPSGDRSGTKSDAFSGYSSGKAERSASSRGASSRSRSGGGGGGGRSRKR